jgi:SAM-dependent methyltransferase
VLARFIAFNRRLSMTLNRVWPYPLAGTFWDRYVERARGLALKAAPPKAVDVGAGRTTPYAVGGLPGVELVGLDILPEDLEANAQLDRRVAHDLLSGSMPAEAQDAGLITSRMVLEHIADQDTFAAELYASLAPGGRTIHLFAGKYSLFAILNRLLPDALAKRMLYVLRPESVDVGGFVTYYDRTNAGAIREVFERAGFSSVQTEVSYEVSQYFHFLFPAFVAARLWETLLDRAGRQDAGSFVLLTASARHCSLRGRHDEAAAEETQRQAALRLSPGADAAPRALLGPGGAGPPRDRAAAVGAAARGL